MAQLINNTIIRSFQVWSVDLLILILILGRLRLLMQARTQRGCGGCEPTPLAGQIISESCSFLTKN